MSARDEELPSGAGNQEAIAKVIRGHLSDDAIATMLAFIRLAADSKPDTDRALKALQEVEGFADMLTSILGVDEHNRLMDELGL